MSSLKLFNTLSRSVEELKTKEPGKVRLYACGPTVYNFAHIGNFRTFVYEDLLRRTLKYFGFQVRHVMNLTDVDDKTIRDSRKAGEPLRSFTEKFAGEFRQDMATLNLETPDDMPRATDYIPEMIEIIQRLLDRGNAYRSEDGSVYFRVQSFPAYGDLARLDKAGLQVGARVAQDEYVKESFGDFAVWKAWVPEDGDVAWDAPWGRGRPGWHIECSALARRFLGDDIDLHCGGEDLVFPHHENEIAQSEAAYGGKFCRCWGHSRHLFVNHQKMSKSDGTFYTVRDVLARGYTGRQLRYVLMSTHYRKELNFTWESLEAAKVALERIDSWKSRFVGSESGPLSLVAEEFLGQFKAALGEDLNISGALGHLFDFIRETNRRLDAGEVVTGLPEVWSRIDSVLGLGDPVQEIPPEVQSLVDRRAEARKAKNFAESDRLRGEISALGWDVKDTPKGQEIKKK
jgi:cysteinyl-tRNA synthetase